MKKLACPLSAHALLLPSCVVEIGSGYNPSSYAPATSYEASLRAIYNRGYSFGKSDASQGGSSKSTAYSSSYDFVGKVKFIEGDNNGYRNYSCSDVNPEHPQGCGAMTAEVGQGQVTIRQGGQVVSTLRIAAPKVEAHHLDDKVNAKGYMGHDQFAVGEGSFLHRFPIYPAGDTNSKPTGKTRHLQYKLKAGEAGWVLRRDKAMEY